MFGDAPRTAWLCLGLGGLLLGLPSGLASVVRDHIRATLKPAQQWMLSAHDGICDRVRSMLSQQLAEQQREITGLKQQLNVARQRERQAWLITAQARQQVVDLREQPNGMKVNESQPLFASRAVEVRVLGRELLSSWKAKHLLEQGQRAGLQDDQWVLDGQGLKLDQGEDSSLVPGLMVFAGRSIVGRIHESGRWVSSMQLITDRDFRSTAAVGRITRDGLQFSTAGLIQGEGGGQCRVTQVPASEPVSVGDGIYSVPDEGAIEVPLMFGRVVAATRGPLHWDLIVKPDIDPQALRNVLVLTTSFNAQRLVGRTN